MLLVKDGLSFSVSDALAAKAFLAEGWTEVKEETRKPKPPVETFFSAAQDGNGAGTDAAEDVSAVRKRAGRPASKPKE